MSQSGHQQQQGGGEGEGGAQGGGIKPVVVMVDEQWSWSEVQGLGLLSPPFATPINTARYAHPHASLQDRLELEDEPHLEEPAVTALPILEQEGEARVRERKPRRQVDWGRTEEAGDERGGAAEGEVAGKRGWPSCSFDGMEVSTANGTGKKEGAADGGGGAGGSDEKPAPPPPSAAFGELFRFADGLDYVLMAIGTVGAVVHGCSLPIFLRFFADLVHSFGSNADDPDAMVRQVVKYAFYFLVVGAAIWASSWAEISCWMWTGERQSTKMRIKYLEAALNQDVSYFDTEVRTSDVVYAINADAVMVQDAISEKLGNFIHYMATFVSGFAVGFTAAWQLALVTLAVAPLIAVIGVIHTTTMAKLSSKSQSALSEASNVSEQALAQIRAVQSFVGEARALRTYSAALQIAQRLGYKSGFAKGIGLGATYFTVFCCYALLLWYGGHLVRHHHTNGGLAIATMFSVMIGGL